MTKPKQTHRKRWQIRWLFLTPLVVFGIAFHKQILGLAVGLALLVALMVGTRSSVDGKETARVVGDCIASWADSPTSRNPDASVATSLRLISQQVVGIRGQKESAGIHGDGTDWFEIELAPQAMKDVKSTLPNVQGVKVFTSDFPNVTSSPRWWPTSWPEGTTCFCWRTEYLLLPGTGTHAWFLRIRT